MEEEEAMLIDDELDGSGLNMKPPPFRGRGTPLPQELMWRELGVRGSLRQGGRTASCNPSIISDNLAQTADHNLVSCDKKLVTKNRFKLPPGVRTTFHIAFSGDGKLVASCHGDHNIYVCEIKSGKVVKTLSGHPRTPWCVTFHPTQSDVLASGCLAGHVRVWDLKGGSELFVTDSGTVIASLAFHPRVRLLAIGTFNEVIFWDWSRGPIPLARTSTENHKEKVRLVRFDSTGRSLITGITNFPTAPISVGTSLPRREGINLLRNLGDLDIDPDIQEELEERQDRFQESYRQLVNHYEDLVQHYHTFLRSRIPRMLQGEGGSGSSASGGDDDSPRPGPSSAIRSGTGGGTGSRSSQGQGPSGSGGGQPSQGASSAVPGRGEFGSIEALAQNIMEMQNLCSQARQRVRLGPPAMETQHIVELQQIRQHLEVLQDQTRRLQYSIRATLSSLATGTGSIGALSTAAGNPSADPGTTPNPASLAPGGGSTGTTNTASNSVLYSNISGSGVTTSTPSNSNAAPISSPALNLPQQTQTQAAAAQTQTQGQQTEEMVLPRPRRSISPSTSNPTSFFRISINSSSNSNPSPSGQEGGLRMRAPAVLRYGPSSEGRRFTWAREFVIDHHSRNCPFNMNAPPPPSGSRTRCLIEETGTVEVEPWPEFDTGMATSTRSFAILGGSQNPGPAPPVVQRSQVPTSSQSARIAARRYLADDNLRAFSSRFPSPPPEASDTSENWQRNFLSGLALVPTSVREGRRSRSLRIRRNYFRSQIPLRLNSSFSRSFYIRVESDLVPVYSSHHPQDPVPGASPHEVRDSLNSHVFVFPISVFFPDFDSSQQVGIYWPCSSGAEEEALSDARRYEAPISVFPTQSPSGRRVRVSYDSNSLDLEVGGVRLGIVQPGVQVLEAVTLLRGAGITSRGVLFVEHMAPLLEGMERYFSQQVLGRRRRHAAAAARERRRIITFAREREQRDPSTQPLVRYEFPLHGLAMAPRISQFHDPPPEAEESRRVLSLAVETAASTASELFINRRPVESRIERVLNNSTALAYSQSQGSQGGQGQGTSSTSSSTGNGRISSFAASPDHRFDEMIQRRINILADLSNRAAAGVVDLNVQLPPAGHGRGLGGRPEVQPGVRRGLGPDEGLIINRSQGSLLGHHHWVIRRQRRFTNNPMHRSNLNNNNGNANTSNSGSGSNSPNPSGPANNNNNNVDSGTSARTRAASSSRPPYGPEEEMGQPRFWDAFSPEILITPRATLNGSGSSGGGPPIIAPVVVPPPTSNYYHLDAATTSFLSSRVQRWDFSEFVIPDISKRHSNIVVRECSLHSDACLDVSPNSEFLAVLQPSDSGAYSALGVYSLKDESVGELLWVYHFDQNTVSVSISPSSEFICVGYAGKGPMYRYVQQGNSTSRNIGQILSLRGKNGTPSPIRDLYAENSGSVMAINCMHFLPIPGMGIVYGTNTGELVLLQ